MNIAKKTPMWVSQIVVIISILVLLLSLFLPYLSATEEWMDWVELFEDELSEKYNMDLDSLENMSMVEFVLFFKTAAKDDKSWEGADVFTLVIVILLAVFSLLALLCAAKKKPGGIIVFDCLLLGVFSVENWLYSQLEIVPISYNWTVAYFVYFVALVAAFVGAVWMIIDKAKNKKISKAEVNQQIPT